MGLQAECEGLFEGQVSQGKALLESDQLVFRGNYRIAVRFEAIQHVSEAKGRLSIVFDKGTLVLDLGKDAARWEEKIKNPKSLLDKLGIKKKMIAALHGIDDTRFLKELKETGIQVNTKPLRMSDIIFVQVESKEELRLVQSVAKNLAKNGALWIVYPKGQKDLKQEDIFKAGKSADLVDVKVVSFSPTYTALKFVIPVSKRK